MRTRDDIEHSNTWAKMAVPSDERTTAERLGIVIEVLLDIRDLLAKDK